MKKTVCILLCLWIFVTGSFAEVSISGFDGGVIRNENDLRDQKSYYEVVFITGEPILLSGTVKISDTEKKVSYEFSPLQNQEGTVVLNRKKLELEKTTDNRIDGQTSEVLTLNPKITETITVTDGGNQVIYTLGEYQFHNSTLRDSQAIIKFLQGNWLATKRYTVSTGGELFVEISGNNYGYRNYWGDTETQKIHFTYTYENVSDAEQNWVGDVDMHVSFNRTKEMSYYEYLSNITSFDGSYTLTEQESAFLNYTYNFPKLQKSGTGEKQLSTLPTQQKLPVHKYEDVEGHWAASSIKKLTGLNVIADHAMYFGPNLFARRRDFAKYMAISMNLVGEEENSYINKLTYKKEAVNPPVFNDILQNDPDYIYMKAVKDNGVMYGKQNNGQILFYPEDPVTRVEAAAIIARALGIRFQGFSFEEEESFRDDNTIPNWAKESVYTLKRIGILDGDEDGYFHPNVPMTKAEAATLIEKLIEYLAYDLRTEYVEEILSLQP